MTVGFLRVGGWRALGPPRRLHRLEGAAGYAEGCFDTGALMDAPQAAGLRSAMAQHCGGDFGVEVFDDKQTALAALRALRREPEKRPKRKKRQMTNTTEPLVTSGGRRGCGYRESGGAYLAVPLGPGGRPVEEFLVDPPTVVDQAKLGLHAVGITLVERDGVTHVLDIVGREHYPTVAAFIDEARTMGISRRASANTDFTRITRDSRLLLLHADAEIANAPEFPTERHCPCRVDEHLAEGFGDMCARLWWDEPLVGAQHRLAIVASFPIPQIEVVRDHEGGKHAATATAAARAGIPVIEVDR